MTMKNPFKKYKVSKSTVVVYDTYKQGSYTRNKTLKIDEGSVVYGDKLRKGDNDLLSFDATEFGVDELVQIPYENVEKVTPWGVIIAGIVVLCSAVVFIVKRKK